MRVIGIVESKISGKETAAEYIAANFDAKCVAYSDVLFDILSIIHVPATSNNLTKLSSLREVFGENVFIHALHKKISDLNAPLVIINGINSEDELADVRSYDDNAIIAIHRSERTVSELEKHADYHIKNLGTVQEFYVQLDTVIKDYLKE